MRPEPEKAVLTVSEVTSHVKRLLDRSELLQDLEVRGEVSNFKRHTSGHLYFSLSDDKSQLSCVCFRNNAARLQFEPEDGMLVLAAGSVSVYERGGRYQLYVRSMRPDGLGELYLAFERLRAKLEGEGLFAESRKRPLPAFPRAIALVTSPTGAAIRDLVSIMGRRYPAARLVVVPTLVQGEQAPPSIVRSLQVANSLPEIEVIVLARGGGSMEDLWCFNDEAVARAIFGSQKPVVSAIGHETDFTIADYVADLRAATPSAAAELVVPDQAELRARLAQLATRLRGALLARAAQARERLEGLAERRVLKTPQEGLWQRQQAVDDLAHRLGLAMERRRERWAERSERLGARLEALSPQATLRRGYSVTQRAADERVIRSVSEIEQGLDLKITVADGAFGARAESVEKEAER